MRCFIALWPDEFARDRLHALARVWHQRHPAARCMRGENLHLTLAFIGEVDAAIARRIVARISVQSWPAGTWQVDRLGVFDKARVLWAGSGDEAHLSAVAAKTRQILDELQVRYDRKPFAPHVTLLRNLPRAAFETVQAIDPPITWPMHSPALLYSTHAENGTRYVALDPSG
jgi:RNA 2',3'-cyclic 3'-phosphodiesterase